MSKDTKEITPQMSFEDAYQRLSEIVESLESGNQNLTEMTSLFEEGMRLSRFCGEQLDQVEQKVKILVDPESGESSPF